MSGIISYSLSTKIWVERINIEGKWLLGPNPWFFSFHLYFWKLLFPGRCLCASNFGCFFNWNDRLFALNLYFFLGEPSPGSLDGLFEILDGIGASFPILVENHSCGRCSYLESPGSSCNCEIIVLDQFDKCFAFLSLGMGYFKGNSWIFSFSLSAFIGAHKRIMK